MTHTINDNNSILSITYKNGVKNTTVLGEECPFCSRFFKNEDNEDWLVDAGEHITYCNPAHRRAEFGERW